MNRSETRRPLEDMIGELVDGLAVLPALARRASAGNGLTVTGVELALPIEARVLGGPSGPIVLADMPGTRTRTAFDLPVGRFVLRLTATPTEALS
jgi:hypothetical protein